MNVKSVKRGDEVAIDENITPKLRREGLMREVIRHVQSARKNAGLNVDDRIVLRLESVDDELSQSIKEHAETISSETLAQLGDTNENESKVKIEGVELDIWLQKK